MSLRQGAIASEQAINRLQAIGEFPQNRELSGKYWRASEAIAIDRADKKTIRAQFNEACLEDLVAVWAPLADCG